MFELSLPAFSGFLWAAILLMVVGTLLRLQMRLWRQHDAGDRRFCRPLVVVEIVRCVVWLVAVALAIVHYVTVGPIWGVLVFAVLGWNSILRLVGVVDGALRVRRHHAEQDRPNSSDLPRAPELIAMRNTTKATSPHEALTRTAPSSHGGAR